MKGYGRALSSLQIYDGIFDQGLLQGIGVHYNIKEKTYVFGEFNKNSCTNIISSGSGFPKNLLCNILHYPNRFLNFI